MSTKKTVVVKQLIGRILFKLSFKINKHNLILHLNKLLVVVKCLIEFYKLSLKNLMNLLVVRARTLLKLNFRIKMILNLENTAWVTSF